LELRSCAESRPFSLKIYMGLLSTIKL